MLVDLPEGWAHDPEHPLAVVYTKFTRWPEPVRLGLGQYTGISDIDIQHLVEYENPFDMFYAGDSPRARVAAGMAQAKNDTPREHGVCDHPDQVLERWPTVLTDTRPLLITYQLLRREDQRETGWRWHKNGLYIGNQRPQHEYLYHDTHIEQVWQFEFHQLKSAS